MTINRLYHAKRTVRLRGQKLAGWSPKDVAVLAKRQDKATCAECQRLARLARDLQAEVDQLRALLEGDQR